MLGRDVLISWVRNIPWSSQKTKDFRREIIWDFFSSIWDFFATFCQASHYRARFQASSGHSDSANGPGYEATGYRLSPNYFQKFKQMAAPDWTQKMLCIIVPNRRTVSLEFFSWVRTRRLLSGSFTKLLRARETFIFYFPNRKRRNYRWVEKAFGMLSAGAIQFAPKIFCFWRITMYRK